MSSGGQIEIGVLAGPYLSEWQVDAITRIQNEPGMSISLVVRPADANAENPGSWNTKDRFVATDITRFLEALRREKAWAFVLAERNVAKLVGDEKPSFRRHAVESLDCLGDTEHVRCVPQTNDGWTEFGPDIVARVETHCDVLVRFGFGLVRGDVLTAPKHGVLSFHPADIRRYRGMGPPIVFHDGCDSTAPTLQRLDESIDGGEIVASVDIDISDCYTLWDVFDRVLTSQSTLLVEGITNACDPEFEPTRLANEELGSFHYRKQRRTLGFSARVLAKNVGGRLVRRFRTGSPSADPTEQPTHSSD